jgi:RND family efflux transporter MFP subunit
MMLTACGHEQADLEPADLPTVRASTTTVEVLAEAVPIEVRGTLQPARSADVSSRVSGPVIEVEVEAGDLVQAGDPLVHIQPDTSEGQLSQAQGALAQASAALALAEKNFHRFERLHAKGAASEVELDGARMEHERAQGAVKQAQGAVRAASSVAAETVAKAPFAGRVARRLIDVGDMVAPGRPLVRVETLAGQQIWLTVREADINRITDGQEITVRLDAKPELGALPATVDEIVPSADPATHTFTVKATLDADPLPSGLAGRGSIPGELTERLVVPRSAVHVRGGLELVIVRAADDTAQTRAVSTGAEVGTDRIEILAGLAAGDEVVVDAPGPVPDGSPLEVVR